MFLKYLLSLKNLANFCLNDILGATVTAVPKSTGILFSLAYFKYSSSTIWLYLNSFAIFNASSTSGSAYLSLKYLLDIDESCFDVLYVLVVVLYLCAFSPLSYVGLYVSSSSWSGKSLSAFKQYSYFFPTLFESHVGSQLYHFPSSSCTFTHAWYSLLFFPALPCTYSTFIPSHSHKFWNDVAVPAHTHDPPFKKNPSKFLDEISFGLFFCNAE